MMTCPHCKSNNIVLTDRYEYVCTQCGTVVGGYVVTSAPEYKTVSLLEHPEREHYHPVAFGNVIPSSPKLFVSDEARYIETLKLCYTIADALRLPLTSQIRQALAHEVRRLIALSRKHLNTVSVDSIAVMAVYIVYKYMYKMIYYNVMQLIKEFAKRGLKLKTNYVNDLIYKCKCVSEHVERRAELAEKMLSEIAQKLGFDVNARKVALEILRALMQKEKSRTTRALVAAALALTASALGLSITTRNIARACNVEVFTVNNVIKSADLTISVYV